MDALHRFAALEIRASSAAERELLAERVRDVVDRGGSLAARGAGRPLLGVLQPAERSFGLGACEAVGRAGSTDRPDDPIDVAPVERPPASVVGAPLLVEVAGAASAIAHRGVIRPPSVPMIGA